MMISSPTAGAPSIAPAALDRAAPAATPDASDDSSPVDASPDVVVSLGGAKPPAMTYDATGRLPGGPSLNDLGANGPKSLANASEALAAPDDADAPDASAVPAADGAVAA